MDITCVTVDCADPARVAEFWNAALGWGGVAAAADGSGAVCRPASGGMYLEFVRVPEPKAVKNRVHLGCTAGRLDRHQGRPHPPVRPEGPFGMVTAERGVVVVSRGSEYGAGTPTAALDHQVPYLRLILGLLGIEDVRVVALDGQGPTYRDPAESFAAAEAQVRALAVERDAPQPA